MKQKEINITEEDDDVNLKYKPHEQNSSSKQNSCDNNDNNKTILSKKIRWIILILLCILHSVVAITAGVFSSAVTQIKNDLSLNDQQFGTFGTISGLGSLFGSLLFTLVISIVNHKYFLIISIVFNCIGHALVYYGSQYYLLILGRFISGVVCVHIFLYLPLWAAQFAIQEWRTFMMTSLQLSGTIGSIWGYLINIIIGPKQWKEGFMVEIKIEFIIALLLLFIPNDYFKKNLFYFGHNVPKKESFNSSISSPLKSRKNTKTYESIFITDYDQLDKSNTDNSDLSDDNINETKVKKNSFYSTVICNIILICLCLARNIQYFIDTAIMYWYTDYIESGLNSTNSKDIFISYTMSSTIASLLGVPFGGIVGSLTGGFDGENSPLVILILNVISSSAVIAVPYAKDVMWFTIFISFCNFVMDGAISFEIGLTYSVIPKRYAGLSTGLIGLFFNLFAFFPSPYVYGVLKQNFGSSCAMSILTKLSMITVFVSVICLMFSHKERIRKLKKKKKEEEGIMLQEIKE